MEELLREVEGVHLLLAQLQTDKATAAALAVRTRIIPPSSPFLLSARGPHGKPGPSILQALAKAERLFPAQPGAQAPALIALGATHLCEARCARPRREPTPSPGPLLPRSKQPQGCRQVPHASPLGLAEGARPPHLVILTRCSLLLLLLLVLLLTGPTRCARTRAMPRLPCDPNCTATWASSTPAVGSLPKRSRTWRKMYVTQLSRPCRLRSVSSCRHACTRPSMRPLRLDPEVWRWG
jgi:hypothetical protein